MWQHSTTEIQQCEAAETKSLTEIDLKVLNPFLVVNGYHCQRYYLFKIYIFISVTLNRKDTAWSSQLEYLQQSNWHQITFIVLRPQLFPTCGISTNGRVMMESDCRPLVYGRVCVCDAVSRRWVASVSSSTTAIRKSLKVTLLWSTDTRMMKPVCRSQESSPLLRQYEICEHQQTEKQIFNLIVGLSVLLIPI